MRILYIAPYVPSPIRVRPFNLLSGLAKCGHSIDIIIQYSSPRDAAFLAALSQLDGIQVEGFFLSKYRALSNCARALLCGESLWHAYGRSRRFSAALENRSSAEKYDVIHLEHLRALWCSPLLARLQEAATRPALVYDAVDCISGLLSHYARQSPSFARRLLYRLESARVSRLESCAVKTFDRIIITSEHEKELLLCMAGNDARIDVVPNGVDLEFFRPPETSFADTEESLLFVGRMSFYNNVEAVIYFVNEIFPLIKRRRPRARLVVAGADPPAKIRALGRRADIEITGYVDDLRPHLQQARAVVCPMLTAVGIQNKVLEAMASNKAVITTSIAAKALAADPGSEIIVADRPQDFAAAAVDLLANPQSAKRLGGRARAYVERHHNWDDSVRRLLRIYAEAVPASSAQCSR